EIMGNAINEVADYALQLPVSVPPAQAQRAVLADVVPALRALPGVQRVDAYGVGDEALWVQPDLAAMHRYKISVNALVEALKAQVLLTPGGYLSQGHQDVFIEARNLPVTAAQIEAIPVPGPEGPIPLRALARVVRSAVPTLNAVLLDGRPALALSVFKQPGASTVPVTRAVAAALEGTLPALPAGVRWVRTYNQGRLVGVVGKDLGTNLIVGGILAILVLIWALGGSRDTLILGLSIPLSLLMGVAALYAAGQSLDLMTLGALTVAVGLLADDAIIVLESIYHRWEQGDEHWAGIAQGVKDIAGPDITGTLTTVSVFVPLLFVGGLAGLFFIPFALAMMLSLLASLLVSLTFIPLSLGFIKARHSAKPAAGARALERLRVMNVRVFELVLRRPGKALAACVGLFLASLAALAIVPVNFLPLPNEGVLLESFTLPPGSSLTDTQAAVAAVTERLRADPAVAHTLARVGSPSSSAYTEPAYAGEITIPLKPGVNFNSLDRIGARLLAASQTTGIQVAVGTPTLERVGESLSGLPQPFVLDIFGSRISVLRGLSEQFSAALRKVPSLTSIFNNNAYPVSQIRLEPDAGALAAYSLTPGDLQRQVEPLVNGVVAARVPDGNVPLDLYVRLADAPEKSLAQLGQLPIRTSGWTPLGQLARLSLAVTPNQLLHIGGARALEILAIPTGPLGSAISAARAELSKIALPPGYRFAFGGLYPELEHAALGLGAAAVAAFVLMIGIMILQFDGLLAPGLLLLLTPLAFTGGAIALAVSTVGLNATGLVAFLTLIGIGLNHGIVLLYRVHRNELSGMAPEAAVREAIHVRFRPIVLTTLTAVLGMLPTALGFGQGAAPEQGLAVVTLGGIIWSALLSTNLIPALYLRRRLREAARGASS
ncbi:MAG: efflux RND transporter permease subunit, partial [Elusimicrobia bacterium]|nr:efflux RND transporter permease subunit [Elusimicrobiota bacterium]